VEILFSIHLLLLAVVKVPAQMLLEMVALAVGQNATTVATKVQVLPIRVIVVDLASPERGAVLAEVAVLVQLEVLVEVTVLPLESSQVMEVSALHLPLLLMQ